MAIGTKHKVLTNPDLVGGVDGEHRRGHLTVLTNNLILGMALGTFAWILTRAATRRTREVTATVWGMAVVFVVYLVVMTRIT